MFVLHPFTIKSWQLSDTFCILLIDDWSWFVWTAFYKLQPGLQLQAIHWLFLDRWEVLILHPQKNPDSCQAHLNFIDWWLIMSHLNELLQVTTRSSAVSNSVTFSWQMRGARSSSTKKNPDSCQAHLNFIGWWLSMSHLNELLQVTIRCSAVSNSVTFSRQMRDVRSSSLHNKVLTAV